MTSKITVDLDLLRNLLQSTAPFACLAGASALPVLEAVELRGCGGFLVATTTDRYVVAMKRAAYAGVHGFYALLPMTEVKHFLSTFKTTRRDGPAQVTLTVADDQLRVTRADGIFAGCFDLAVTYRLAEGKFPDLFEMFAQWEPGPGASTAYNPGLLAKFQAAVDRYEPMHLMPGKADKPTLVVAGNMFGAIMPTRTAGTPTPDPAAWLHAVNPVKAVTK